MSAGVCTSRRDCASNCAFCMASAGTEIGAGGTVKGSISTSGVGSSVEAGGVCTTIARRLLLTNSIGGGGRVVGSAAAPSVLGGGGAEPDTPPEAPVPPDVAGGTDMAD